MERDAVTRSKVALPRFCLWSRRVRRLRPGALCRRCVARSWFGAVPTLLLLLALGSVSGCRSPGWGRASHSPHILMVVTSHGQIDDGHPTGLWLEEFAVPYRLFDDAGCRITVASPSGGKAPVDPRSLEPSAKPENTDEAMALLKHTVPLKSVDLTAYHAVFFPGGHGTMFDFPNTPSVTRTVEHFLGNDLPAAFVCHGPAALVNARTPGGMPMIAGKTVTGFTNEEERAVDLVDEMPFLLEDRLKALGATFDGASAFSEHVVVDGSLVTGQNPASSAKAASQLLRILEIP